MTKNNKLMKKLHYLILPMMVLAVYACSRRTENSKPKLVLTTHKEAIDTMRQVAQKLPMIDEVMENAAPIIPLQIIKEVPQTAFEKIDYSDLLCTTDEDAVQYGRRFDGFYGKDNYRIEMYFGKVTQDPNRKNVYLVEGKSRYKKTVVPFEGEIVFEKATLIKDPNMQDLENVIDDESEMNSNQFTALEGTFKLKENASLNSSGIFEGKVFMDILTKKKGDTQLWYYSPESKAQGGGFKFDGNWTSYKTGSQKHIVWAKDIFNFADSILEKFSIGEREVEINPKYRHLGWDKYWENDEWWSDAKVVQ
jgi:hypothetical protein